ncbi:MAG: MOSC domain-containing protein [Candidatus Marinimicrobia bacterium]|nr:MOSC domain-containing protein [Candidatus Neomarinimicrobiota bacterium]MBL7023739.1 MOSC domain-containing protein [Candidatus Neomarinimicrobiota bacterium]MBL7109591.1 MOSC domain-containing protein [Candidatus Neomarinimicrobiota bacterium]
MGTIEAICISKKKGIVKKEIPSATLVKDSGIEGDAHAGDWHRQVSLLAGESIDVAKEKLPTLARGAFAENIITRDIELRELKIGDQLKLGDSAILEITQIGKECHTACAIKNIIGDCIMPKEGIFAKVIDGGEIKAGSQVEKI